MKVQASVRGAQLKTLLRKGITISKRLKKLEEDTKARAAELLRERSQVEKAILKIVESFDNRDPHDTMTFTLDQIDARGVEVSWAKEYPVDYESAVALQGKLGDHFPKVFSVRPAISRARSFKTWMSRDQGPTINRLKKAVEACVEMVFKGPKFKWRFETDE